MKPPPSSPDRMENIYSDATKKRRKGATRLSCAECRRLKLRCDRAVPCGSCVKRGCGAICPDGSLTTGQGNRFVLASTQELHEKISELSQRVRHLEDGLRYSHSLVSTEKHPLLTDDLLQIKSPLQRDPPNSRNLPRCEAKEEDQNGEVVDAFGSLSINAAGGAKYFGSIANSWYFLQNEANEDHETDSDRLVALQTVLPVEILARSGAFPIMPSSYGSIQVENVRLRTLFWYLPESAKAQEICQTYYRLGAWMYNPIRQQCFYEDIYPHFYTPNTGPPSDDPLLSHKLSLMFMILAIGTLMDIHQPAYSIEAEKYHQLARAALFQSSLFDDPTINAVQALFLMTFYLFLSDRHGSNSGARWAIMGIAIKVAQSIGLHREPSRLGLDPKETLRRRELFWELYTYDSWQCLTFGRPVAFSMAHIDCRLPYSNDAPEEKIFHAWKHRFASECMSVVHDQAFGAKTPTYATVLQLDRKLRAFPVPPALQVVGFGGSSSAGPTDAHYSESVMLMLQRHIVLAIREMNLLYLHRSFFARAVTDHPKDPLGSPYGTSVIAAYRSAGSLVALMRNLHTQLKEPSERIWFLWGHMFSCSIILGSVVTRCPSMSLAPSALMQLDSACELFSKAARGFRAQSVLEVMLALQEKAHLSLNEHRKGQASPLTRQLSEPYSPHDDLDELATLGGKTRLVAKKDSVSASSSPAVIDRSPTSLNPIVPLPLMSGNTQVHPNVLAYLQTFPNSGQSHNRPTYTNSSTYSMSPTRENEPRYHETSGYSDPHTSMQPMELVPGQFPSYFPVYDYGLSTESNYSQLNGQMSNTVTTRRESPENGMHNTWQDFVTQSGLGMES